MRPRSQIRKCHPTHKGPLEQCGLKAGSAGARNAGACWHDNIYKTLQDKDGLVLGGIISFRRIPALVRGHSSLCPVYGIHDLACL